MKMKWSPVKRGAFETHVYQEKARYRNHQIMVSTHSDLVTKELTGYWYLITRDGKFTKNSEGEEYATMDAAKAAAIAYVDSVTRWGGARPGAGRPPVAEKKQLRSIRLTDAEYDRVKAFIKQMREECEEV